MMNSSCVTLNHEALDVKGYTTKLNLAIRATTLLC